MTNRALTGVDIEALWEHTIPCGGVRNEFCRRHCSHAATLIWTDPHNCLDRAPTAADFKCPDCWMVLYQHLANTVARSGYVWCAQCSKKFNSVLAFTDFRPI